MADENTPAAPAGEPSGDEKVMAAISYLGILFIVPLLVKKDSKFVMGHAKQGMVLFIAEIAVWILDFIFSFMSFFFGWIFWLLWVVVGVLALVGLIQALSGKTWKAPVIGSFADSFKF